MWAEKAIEVIIVKVCTTTVRKNLIFYLCKDFNKTTGHLRNINQIPFLLFLGLLITATYTVRPNINFTYIFIYSLLIKPVSAEGHSDTWIRS
jgi:hypothetical protein